MTPRTLPCDLRHRTVVTLDITTTHTDPRLTRITTATIGRYNLGTDTAYDDIAHVGPTWKDHIDDDALIALIDEIDRYTDLQADGTHGAPLVVRDAPRYLTAIDAEARRAGLLPWAAPTYVLDVAVLSKAFGDILPRDLVADPLLSPGQMLSGILRGVSGMLDTCDPRTIHEAQGAWWGTQRAAERARLARFAGVEEVDRLSPLGGSWPQWVL